MSRTYDKPPLPISDQVNLLIKRGLICNDKPKLEKYLISIGYYRLSAYCLPFEQPCQNTSRNHDFISGTDFEKILNLYIFDRKLRLLVMEAIERIEVALRSYWSYSLAMVGGSHAYINPELFKDSRKHIRDLAKFEREYEDCKEVFIQHYKNTYDNPALPPIWCVVETMTLGSLSRWFQNTKNNDIKKEVMKKFNLPTIEITESVFHALTPVRNVCAHHSRLWNRRFAISLPDIKRLKESLIPSNSPNHQAHYLYNYLVILLFLMGSINPKSSWKNRLIDLLDSREAGYHKSMGFPEDWKNRKIWAD